MSRAWTHAASFRPLPLNVFSILPSFRVWWFSDARRQSSLSKNSINSHRNMSTHPQSLDYHVISWWICVEDHWELLESFRDCIILTTFYNADIIHFSTIRQSAIVTTWLVHFVLIFIGDVVVFNNVVILALLVSSVISTSSYDPLFERLWRRICSTVGRSSHIIVPYRNRKVIPMEWSMISKV